MEKLAYSNLSTRFCLVLALTLATGSLSACTGHRADASPEAALSSVQAQSVAPAEDKMMARCQQMQEQKQKMMADMKAQDAALTEQIATMNSASKDKKMRLMAAVITSMVEQRITMDARKAKMEEEMMQHMMQHMQMGKNSMSQCPMMKGMKDMDEKSTDVYNEHQKEQK